MQTVYQRFNKRVLAWYDKKGRHDLPWQSNRTGYRVWVSEIMLQQTQVNTVIPYYQRFMKAFPTVRALATASLDTVLTHWAGLGYYARGRHLHSAAQLISTRYHGRFPRTLEALITLPGIGRSTAGAILSLAYNIRAPILDANVRRVLSRFFAVSGAPSERKTQTILWELAEQCLPVARCRDYNQAMMDIGALICTSKKPQCAECPLNTDCAAHLNHCETAFPQQKKSSSTRVQKKIYMLLCYNLQGRVLLEKRPPMGIWGGLWSLPEYDTLEKLRSLDFNTLPTFKHVFSHFDLWITPLLMRSGDKLFPQTQNVMDSTSRIWYDPNSLPVGLPAPVSALLKRSKEIL